MNCIKQTLCYLLISFAAATSAFAVELHEATHQQILDELARRLGSTTPNQPSSVATYSCDPFGDLAISLIDANGKETTAEVDTNNASSCANQTGHS